ncbi:Gamma-glutamylputrescine oxidoreductase [bacterium HR40]|nr:Gamma-glutamylputrescine oxidoreductase [bacterium HR40]
MPPSTCPTWYEARSRARQPWPAAEGRLEAAFAVVGGGLAGLSTALSLAERGVGREVVLCEAERIAVGASGRNGGMASAGFTRPLAEIERRWGRERARALFALSAEGLGRLRRRIEAYGIACDLVEGVAEVSWFVEADELARTVGDSNARYGTRLEVWPRERVQAVWRTHRYRAAAFDPDGFHLDPLALCRGLAAAAAVAGVRLYEATPVLRLRREGGRYRLDCPRATVYADHVILCTSAVGRPPDRRLARALVPVASRIAVTEPLGRRLADLVRAPFAVFDDRMATGYWRPLPGGRLLWGGGVVLFEGLSHPERALRADLARVFPELADVRFDFVWSGRMGFARHRMPVIRPLEPGLWVAVAFGGQGLNTTAMAGELIAAALLDGDDRFRLFDPFGLPMLPGCLGRLAAQLYYWAFMLRDRIRALRTRR